MLSNFPRTHQKYVVGPAVSLGGMALNHEDTLPIPGLACNAFRWLCTGVAHQHPVSASAHLSAHDRAPGRLLTSNTTHEGE